jgi:hypothetical protein
MLCLAWNLELQSPFHQNEAEGTVSVAADDEWLAASLLSTHAGIGCVPHMQELACLSHSSWFCQADEAVQFETASGRNSGRPV